MVRPLLRCTMFLLLSLLPAATHAAGRCLRFAGDGALAKLEASEYPAHTSDFTIAFWAWPESTGTEQQVASVEFGRNGIWHRCRIEMDSLAHPIVGMERWPKAPNGTATLRADRLTLTVGRWHFVACSCSRGRLRLFMDGQWLGEAELDATVWNWSEGGQTGTAVRLVLGGESRVDSLGDTTSVAAYRGSLNELQLWSVGLGERDLAVLTTHTPSASFPGLVAWWRYDPAQPLVATDAVHRVGSLRLVGGVSWAYSRATLALAPGWKPTPPIDRMCRVKSLYR